MPIVPGIALRKDVILQKVTQEQIFEAYLGLPVDVGVNYINPLRIDKHPGCRYYYNNLGKLYFKDFAARMHLDCFAVVQYKYGCNFITALRIIVKDFNLNGLAPTNNVRVFVPTPKSRAIIRVTVRDWNQKDLDYWMQFNVSPEILKIGAVYPCKAVWFGEEYYTCKSNDPCYCYYGGVPYYKLYFPRREKGNNKFITNISINDAFLFGMHLLPASAPYIVLTKSYKDVLSLYSFGIVACSVHSEYHLINSDLYAKIKSAFPKVYTLMDNDVAGRDLTIKYHNTYDTTPLLFPMRWPKDFSDNVQQKGVDKMKEVIKQTHERLKINNNRV